MSKSLGVAGKGAGASMREIEIVNDTHGAPIVKVSFSCEVFATMQFLATMQYADFRLQLHGDADARAKAAGVKSVEVSISHADSQAMAIAVANF